MELVRAIRDGSVPEEAREWLLASWLIPLDKGNGKIRPIAGGTALVKLTASYLMVNASERLKNVFRFSGTQYGLFMKGGATTAAHMTQLNLDRDPANITIKIDFANAFNTIPRKFILDELYKRPEMTSLFSLVHWAYSGWSPLLVRNNEGDVAQVLQSQEGVRQGCVLGSLAFGVATLTLLAKIKDSHKDIEIVAYLDDVSITGKSESALSAFEQICSEASGIGLAVQREKCEVLIPNVGGMNEQLLNAVSKHGLRAQKGALPLLGSVVGHDRSEMKKLVDEKVKGWEKALALLAHEEMPTQLALLVGRWTMTHKPNMLARSLPPSITAQPLADFGEAVIKTMEERLKLTFTAEARALFQETLRGGGLGFYPPALTAPYAFLAGFAASCLAYRQSNIFSQGWVEGEGWLQSELSECLRRYIDPKLDWPQKKGLTDNKAFVAHFFNTDFSKRSDKLQADLAATFRVNRRKEIKKALLPEAVARLECRTNKATPLLWRAYPLTQEFVLTDEETRFAVAYATGQRLPHLPELCSCGRDTPLTMEHTVHCQEKLTRHNMIQDRLVAFARLHGVTIKQNPRLDYEDAKQRLEPDVIFYPGVHEPVQTDVTVINPCAPFRLANGGHKWATKAQKARKKLKYHANAKARGDIFRPLVFETHGKMSEEIGLTLDMLASSTPTDRGLAVHDMKLDLAVTLARGNALAAKTTIARAQRARERRRAIHPLPAHNRRPAFNNSRSRRNNDNNTSTKD